MEILKAIFGVCYEIFCMEINLFGYTFTLMNIFVFSVVAYLLLVFVLKIFHKGDDN